MADTPTVQFVIAQYKEDLSWLAPIAKSSIIYTKGGATSYQYPGRTIPLPNIGREGHTYLQHIVNAYSNLPDVLVFLQGRIDDHVSLHPTEIKARAALTKPGEVTTFPWRELELFDCWNGIPWDEYPCWEKWSAMKSKQCPKTPGQYFQDLLGYDQTPASVAFQPGAIFAVHKDTILQYPLSFYEDLLHDFFLGEMSDVNPMTGHYMERFWLAIFQPNEYICWNEKTDTSSKERNEYGQLAKGRWHRTPKGVRVDSRTISPSASSNGFSSAEESGSDTSA